MTAPDPILTPAQLAEMRQALERLRAQAVGAMYRTDSFERPFQAGRGEMYQLWNVLGEALKLLDKYEGEHPA